MGQVIPLAGFLIAVYVAGGVGTAFMPLFLSEHGLSAAAIGQVLGMTSLARLITGPAWGGLADHVGQTRRVLLWACALSAVAGVAAFGAYGFVPLLVVIVVQGIGSVSLLPLSDTLCLALARTGVVEYGRIRAIGSIAFMAATMVAGGLIALWGADVVPLMIGGSFALAALLTRFLPEGDGPRRGVSGMGALRVLRNRGFLLTIGCTALIQGSHAAYYAIATLHWRHSGIGDATIGLLWSEGVLAEIILFLWGRRLADRIGPGGLSALAAGCAAFRWTMTGLTTDVAALAGLQMLHGATYGMQHLSAMWMLNRIVPPERAGTAQTLHATLGATAPIGALMWLSGAVYDGSGHVFWVMAGIGGAGLLLAPGLGRAYRRAGA